MTGLLLYLYTNNSISKAIKRFIYILILLYAVLLCAVWLLPVEFTACTRDNWWCRVAYWLTESAGKIGTVLIVVLAGCLYTLTVQPLKDKLKVFFKSILAIVALLAGIAFFNEHILKETLKIARPSHKYIFSQSGMENGLDSLYIRSDDARKEFIRSTIDTHQDNFKTIDMQVLEHWTAESGYSFPSGHSCNAFLLAYILAYSMYRSRNKVVRLLFVLPLVWAVMVAVSRVAIGAHSALDVSAGAALGLLIASLFMYFDVTKKWIIPSN